MDSTSGTIGKKKLNTTTYHSDSLGIDTTTGTLDNDKVDLTKYRSKQLGIESTTVDLLPPLIEAWDSFN